jgi:hypothetical protein
VYGLKDRTITHNRRRPGETVSRSLPIDRHVNRASIELCRHRDVLVRQAQRDMRRPRRGGSRRGRC